MARDTPAETRTAGLDRVPVRPRTDHTFRLAVVSLLNPPLGVLSLRHALKARRHLRAGEVQEARLERHLARQWAGWAGSTGFVLALVAAFAVFLTANNHAVLEKFFDLGVLRRSAPDVLRGFWLNIKLSLIAEAIVLVWALLVAWLRLMPGRPALPMRLVATLYIDVFRGFPAIIVIYLVAFGLPLTGLPVVGDASTFQLCVLALVLVYGAYVAEVYRAGIESVHHSQTAAARALGLSHASSMRHVVLPQAVRRVTPPLLNDFISLQKDTSLVAVAGLLDGFNQSRIYASNEFNLSAVTGIGIAFVLVTVPLARTVDYIAARQARRRGERA
jgi:polar amino acid transport system permease protein